MKILKKTAAVLLVLSLVFSTTKYTKAAEQEYVSNVMVYTASSYDEAEKGLKELGYEIIQGNLNGTFKTGVYLGYQTTTDPEEAITDLAAMNMLGKYSYGSYETIMEKQADLVRNSIEGFLPAIAAFQENYGAGQKNALLAYESVNLYKEDDSGLLMGDYLLQYDFSKASEDRLLNVFLQGNAQVILAIEKAVSMAAENGDETLFERMSGLGPDGVKEMYEGAYPTVAKAMQAMSREYDATATNILSEWNTFYQYLQGIRNSYITGDGSRINEDGIQNISDGSLAEDMGDVPADMQEYVNAIDGFVNTKASMDAGADASLYLLLMYTDFGDGSLLDYFNRPVEEIALSDLYVLAEAMTDSEKSQLQIMGLRDTLIQGGTNFENLSSEGEELVDGYEDTLTSLETISVYSGVDRSIFGEGVAFTDAATQHEKLTGKSWITDFLGSDSEKDAWLTAIIYSSISSAVFLAVGITASYMVNYITPIFNKNAADVKNYSDLLAGKSPSSAFYNEYKQDLEICTYRLNKSSQYLNLSAACKYASIALFLITAIFDIYAVIEYFTTEDPTEEKVPHHLMTAVDTDYGTDYVYYETVKDQMGEPADMNHHEGNPATGWLVLYSTKDPNAGEPILAKNLRVQTGSDSIEAGSSGAHLFNESAVINVTAQNYTGTADTVKGTYILFSRAAGYTGSVISGGMAALLGGSALILGLLLGFLLTRKFKKA